MVGAGAAGTALVVTTAGEVVVVRLVVPGPAVVVVLASALVLSAVSLPHPARTAMSTGQC